VTTDASMLLRTPVDPSVLSSPDWWLYQLELSLLRKRPGLQVLADYATGQAPLMDIAESVRTAYANFQRRARTNFAGLAVDVMLDRTHVAAIRTGADGDGLGDQMAWDIWQANQLDADSNALHRSCFEMGEAFAIVGDVDPDIGAPLITIEDPRQIAIARDPMRRRQIRTALKTFTDEWTGWDHAYLYMRGESGGPAYVLRAERSRSFGAGGWHWLGEPQALPFGQVPVVWFPNQLDIDGITYWGEFEQHTDVLDRINSTVLQRLVTGAMQAFRQRMLKGLPVHDANGAEIDYDGMFAADPAALWQVPAGVEMWESQITDMTPMLMAARDDIKDFAAVTRTPLPALSPDAANQSAQGSEIVWSGHISKVIDRMSALSESWEQVTRLAFLWLGDEARASRRDMEVLWTPPDIPSMSERFDAASKAKAAGVPQSYIMANIVGMTPQEMRRYADEMAATAVESAGPAASVTATTQDPPQDPSAGGEQDPGSGDPMPGMGDPGHGDGGMGMVAIRDDSPFTPTPLQVGQYHALEQLVEAAGKFDQTTGGNGAHYVDPSPFAAEGMACGNCYFFEGPRGCEIVEGDIDPQAVCKLWIIPAELLSQGGTT